MGVFFFALGKVQQCLFEIFYNKYYSRTSVIAVTAETQISFDIITIDLAEKADK